MSEFVWNCPRCYVKHTTFSIFNVIRNYENLNSSIFCACRNCKKTVIFDAYLEQHWINQIQQGNSCSITDELSEISAVCIRPGEVMLPPEFLPDEIRNNFDEGAQCYSIGCFNAAATMFRLCLDKATKSFLPDDPTTPSAKIRRSLGFRMDWLFEHGHLPVALKELAECIKDDGNDGAHDGILSKADVDDLIDFTVALLERLYTEPKKLELAKQRRAERRQQQ
ncbi:DUF4145 domain-containing protein [Aeromonas caviae]|uniref:DUF4145 domain-containing protein n=1 Tax=Aeromonas caviae TaxID=648 RepID=UPI0038CFB380